MRVIPFGRPIVEDAEKQAVLDVLNGTTLTHGPRVQEFERAFAEYAAAPHAVATASCTASMHLAYMYIDLKAGDEVIVSAQTHIATAHAVELCGGTCVFVDSEPITGNIDIDKIESKITKRTRALAVVHYLGLPVDMPRVMEIARRHDLFVVEDCALALGTWRNDTHAGLFGDVGCFSFYPVKHITTAEGGMLITRHKKVADSISRLRAFGIDRNVVSQRKIPGMYDVQSIGLNYRLNEIGAALGIEQMKRLPGFLNRRQENNRLLRERLAEIPGLELLETSHDGFVSSCYCMVMILPDELKDQRADIMGALKAKGVGTSIYYPRAVPMMSYYQNTYGHTEQEFPVACRISNQSIALPVGPHVTADDIEYMVTIIHDEFSARVT